MSAFRGEVAKNDSSSPQKSDRPLRIVHPDGTPDATIELVAVVNSAEGTSYRAIV
ncbi:MAG: hypothetical protein AB4352_04430 [Hormoscilla sp.]